ncbi:hypothetical protein O6H91_20G022900 [Diphasiastrum complanatum]|uniref:Uncharacterized protein n=1 Tax=Diphasiastrum complanatum TaxID=34168 RepID=A0ACC2ANM9_DIPCM|nr:hypothetical protein O6H91_20G022900 [Diphasiastrum complanatum]
MLNFTQKKTSQAQTMDACSVLDGLASNVKTLIDLLPPEDKEVFAYLITRPSEDVNVERVLQGRFWKSKANPQPKSPQQSHFPIHSGKDYRKAGSIKKKGNHEPSFGCDCFQCYMFHWSRWDSSPNRGLIHEAILLNESAGTSKVQGTIDDRAEWERQHGFECYEEKARNSTLSSKSKEIEVNALCLEESPTFKPDELVDVARQVAVDQDILKYPCNKIAPERITAMEVVIDERNSQRQGSLVISPHRDPSREENKLQKKKTPKKIKIAVKGSAGQRQEMHHHSSSVQKSKGELPAKYRTKQVAPIYDKDGCAAETSSTESEANKLPEEIADTKGDEAGKAQKSLTHVLSETWSFVADRLFALWYPRRRRRVPVF